MESINLNLIPTGANPVVHVSQYDTGRVIRFNIFEGSSVYFLDGTETISCNIKKPDNNIVTLSVTNTNDSYVEITTTEQATACDGSNLCEISITKGDDVIGSLNFIMEVERSPIEGGISSASEINNLWTQVDGMVADILADSYDSANVVFDNLPTAGHGIPYTVTSEGIGNAIDNALDMTDTASGAIATFDTSLALPLQDLQIAINAVQESGTPTPSSPKAISGFTGANIYTRGSNFWDEEWEIGAYNLSTGQKTTANNRIRTKNYIAVLPSTTYFNCCPDIIIALFYDINKTFLSQYGFNANSSFVTPSNAYYMNFHVATAYGTTYNNDISINYPATDTAYHAYDGHTTAISWQSEAGTVYGGSLDVTSGLLTVDRASDIINNLTTIYYSAGSNHYLYATISDKYEPTSLSDMTHPLIFEMLPYGGVQYAAGFTDMKCYQNVGKNIYIVDNSLSDKASFLTKYGTARLVWYLATPVTYQLTPTQISAIVGTNNIFTDTNGDTSLEYYTKRGEQTVRIAEGVAVDVINNKSIDTLTTTDKTVVGAVNEVVSTKQAQLNYAVITDEAFTSSTSFAYTGKSVTCPVGHIYIVRARISYSNGEPQEIGASNSSTNADVFRCYARTDKACEVVFVLSGGETAYIWAKYASVSSNTVRITAVDIKV